MKAPIEIVLDKNTQLLRLSCGQCGDTIDIILENVNDPEDKDSIRVFINDKSIDFNSQEESAESFLKPVHLIV